MGGEDDDAAAVGSQDQDQDKEDDAAAGGPQDQEDDAVAVGSLRSRRQGPPQGRTVPSLLVLMKLSLRRWKRWAFLLPADEANRISGAMSAVGPKQTLASAPHMSAFGGKADMTVCRCLLSRSLLGVKRTWAFAPHLSAFDPKRTWWASFKSRVYRAPRQFQP